jgi:hypothetical protein
MYKKKQTAQMIKGKKNQNIYTGQCGVDQGVKSIKLITF